MVVFVVSLFFSTFLGLGVMGCTFLNVHTYIICLVTSTNFGLLGTMGGSMLSALVFLTMFTIVATFSIFTIGFSAIFCVLVYNALALVVCLVELVSGGKSRG